MDSAPAMLRIGTWNTDNAQPGTACGDRVSTALAGPKCDILCVTEGYEKILPAGGDVRDAGPDWGYGIKEKCRRVLIWTRKQWSDVKLIGSPTLPSGRFVAGVTDTPLGPLTVVGVCIPWHDAHVRTGRKDRKRWQEHEKWLTGFEALSYRHATERTIILGDFNQRIPWTWGKKQTYEALLRSFEGFTITTAGDLAGASGRARDHIAHTQDIVLAGDIGIWPERSDDNKVLSDHFGVWGDFVLS